MSENSFSHREVYSRSSAEHGVFPGGASRMESIQRHIATKIGMVSRTIIHPIIKSLRTFTHWLRLSRSPQEFRAKFLRIGWVACGITAGWIILYFGYILFTLPDVDKIGALIAAESTVITDRNGTELYRIHGEEDRTLVSLEEISDFVEQATISIEDQRFYERGCFDVTGFIRAVLSQFLQGVLVRSGGSTLTQQFSKNALIGTRKKKITRKLREYILSCQLERRYTKDEILEFYLNRIPYGNNAHGVEQASQTYFAKSASDLTLAEAAVLAALPQLPTYLSPYGGHVKTTLSEEGKKRFDRGKIITVNDVRDEDFWIGIAGQTFGTGANALYIGGRTDQVLHNMQNQGFITDAERLQALNDLQSISFKRARENIRAPHFIFFIRDFIEQKVGSQFEVGFLESGGLTVTTTLDWDLQQIAEKIVNDVGETNRMLYNAHNAALLAANPVSGHILAYVGNRDYWDEATDGNVDVVRAPRQPGSSFKPFVYAAAFLHGASPSTVLYDIPTTIGDDTPENFDGTFWGPLTIRKALGASRNIPAAKAFFLAGGEDSIVELAADMGVPTVRTRRVSLTAERGTPYEYGWPIALGAAEVPLYEMLQGYMTFARNGKAIDLQPVLKIEDRLGNILYEAPEAPEERDVLDPRVASMITSILSDESARPEGYWRDQLSVPGIQTAAKTGTSNKCYKRSVVPGGSTSEGVCIDSRPDNTWTIGYTPNLITAAWAGNASGGALSVKAAGLTTDSPIWRGFMVAAHRKMTNPITTFTVPPGLASAQISELSGKLASPCTPTEYRSGDIFFEGELPKEFDDACIEIEVDKLTGLMASDECPLEAREKGSFFLPRSELPDRFPLWEQAVQRWAKDLSRSPQYSRAKLPDLVKPLDINTEKDSIFWKVIGTDASGAPVHALRGTGAFLPLPLPLAPAEKCSLARTPGRLIKPSIQIIFPSHGGSASAPAFRPKIEFTVGQGVREVLYELDGKPAARALSGSSLMPMIRLPRRFETAGDHTLKVTIVDSYFNQATDSVRFTFLEDAGIPQVRILAPAEGSTLQSGSEVTVRVEAEDPGGSVDRVQFFLGDQLLTTRRGTSPFELTFTLSAPSGSTTLRATAIDTAKNEGMDEIVITIVNPE